MKTILLKQIKCFENEDAGNDEIRFEIRADNVLIHTFSKQDFNEGDVWILNRSFNFSNSISLKMIEEDWPDKDDHLGTHTISSNTTLIDITVSFTQDDADYELLFDHIVHSTSEPEEITDPRTSQLSIRQFFSRMGRGAVNKTAHTTHVQKKSLYRVGNEVISLRDTFKRHSSQDGNKHQTNSVRKWLQVHCNFWSTDTYINDKPATSSGTSIFFTGKNWKTVADEKSYQLAGFQDYSRVTNNDNPLTHETRDWNWDVAPDPTFMYMLGAGYKGRGSGLERIPLIHNEWETGSFPLEWRPFYGEYLTFWGRFVWDVGHAPTVTEIHPAHTIVREHTTAAPIGSGNKIVAVNQANIGMGFSGGYPGNSDDRWNIEFGDRPDGVWGDTSDCWPTNLRKHPLKFKFYPPVDRPSAGATLKFRIKKCQHIPINGGDRLDDFLEFTQNDDPAEGGQDKAFREWSNSPGFDKVNTEAAFKPKFELRNGPDGLPAYYDVTVDLSGMSNYIVGYYSIIECGWSAKGPQKLQKYELTFKTIKAIETSDWSDDWHLYYGVNGQWKPWWTHEFIEEGATYTKNKKMTFWTVDDMPIAIRDTGIEWDGTDWSSEKLDTVNLVIPGENHFGNLKSMAAFKEKITIVSESNTVMEFRVKGNGGDTKHEWLIKLEKK